jgi:hypothetical protein
MRSVQTTMRVTADGKGRLAVPAGIAPGEHRVVLTLLDEEVSPRPDMTMDEFLAAIAADVGPWPANLSLRREDLYGDEGR